MTISANPPRKVKHIKMVIPATPIRVAMEDFISSLPDELLFHIISLLPFESAIQTIFLSTRWRFLWNLAVVQHGSKEDVPTAVSWFLNNFDEHNPIRNTRRFRFRFSEFGLLSAIIAPNNKLLLDFSGENMENPVHFGWQIELNSPRNLSHEPTPSTFFVKTLSLISVNHLSRDAVSCTVSRFRLLENLEIVDCRGLESLSIDSDTKLLSLTIFDCPQLKSLHVRSYKLRTLLFRGKFPWFWPEFHFNLANAMLDSRQGPGYNTFKSCDFDRVLLTIKNAQVLTLCKWTFEALLCPSLSSYFQFYKLKELCWIDNYSNGSYDCDALITFLKLSPSLEQLFVTIDQNSYVMPTATTCSKQACSIMSAACVLVLLLGVLTLATPSFCAYESPTPVYKSPPTYEPKPPKPPVYEPPKKEKSEPKPPVYTPPKKDKPEPKPPVYETPKKPPTYEPESKPPVYETPKKPPTYEPKPPKKEKPEPKPPVPETPKKPPTYEPKPPVYKPPKKPPVGKP